MQDDDILKDDEGREDLDLDTIKKVDPLTDPLDEAESIEDVEEEEEVEDEPFDDVNPT